MEENKDINQETVPQDTSGENNEQTAQEEVQQADTEYQQELDEYSNS